MNIHFRGAEPIIFRLNAHDRIHIGDNLYRHQATTEDHQVLGPLGQLGNLREISHAEFEQGLFAGTIVVDTGYFTLSQQNARRLGATSLFDLEPADRAVLLHRRRWVEAFVLLCEVKRASRSDAGIARGIKIIEEERLALGEDEAETAVGLPSPSVYQLRKWTLAFLRDQDIMSLRDGRCRSGRHGRTLNDLVEDVITQFVPTFASDTRPNCPKIHLTICQEIDRLVAERGMTIAPEKPSLRTIQRRVEKLPVLDVLFGRHGRAMAMRRMRPVLGGVEASAPFDRIEMDECRVNLMSLMVQSRRWMALTEEQRKEIARIRLWATVAIDCRTRCIAGVHVHAEPPSHRSALTCLHHVLVDKTPAARATGAASHWRICGRPEAVFTDKGAAFISGEFRAALDDMGVTHLKPPAGTPQLRPRIERFFSTTASSLMGYFTGRTFAHVVDRGDYKAEDLASLTAAEFEGALVRWICDVYHNEAHSGLRGRTPMSVWRTETRHHRIRTPPEATLQRVIFGVPFERVLQKTGIRYMNGYYHARPLARMLADHRREAGQEERTVEIRVNPYALSAIAVRTPEGWVTAQRTGYGPAPATPSQPYDPKTAGETFVDVMEHIRNYDRPDALEQEALARDRAARLAAHADLEALAEEARLRSGVGDPCPSPKDLERARKQIEEHFDRWEARLRSSGADIVPEEARAVSANFEGPDPEGRARRAAKRRQSAKSGRIDPRTAAVPVGPPAPAALPAPEQTEEPPIPLVARRSAADLDD